MTTITDKLNDTIDAFVNRYKGIKQRDENWYKAMGTTIGGSEISSLMSLSDNPEFKKLKNPYNTFMDVVKNKIAILKGENPWTGGNEACWWGILFEDVIMSVVEIDLGSKIKGDDICVQVVEGHRNSPDGYIVVGLAGLGRRPLDAGLGRRPLDAGLGRRPLDKKNDDKIATPYAMGNATPYAMGNATPYAMGNATPYAMGIYTTDMDPSLITSSAIALLEFKCPLSRKPNDEIPKHYIPQLWSGLAVSNIASFGIFIDSVFRKCSIDVLGYNTNYDVSYHYRDFPRGMSKPEKLLQQSIWELPTSWGLIFVYSPVGTNTGTNTYEPIDLGKEGFTNFNAVLEQINLKNYIVKRAMPWFLDTNENDENNENDDDEDENGDEYKNDEDEDENGDEYKNDEDEDDEDDENPSGRRPRKELRSLSFRQPARGNKKTIYETIDEYKSQAPEKYHLLGYIPWKLFYISYIPINRRLNFLDEIKPLIDQVHSMVRESFL